LHRARNSRDWQQLIEICHVVDTVLIDPETVYAPRHGNDRLLLGLKGSLNEYELDLLRQCSLSARYEKARRGELIVMAPAAFVKSPASPASIGNARLRSQGAKASAAGHGGPMVNGLLPFPKNKNWTSAPAGGRARILPKSFPKTDF
jgi:hypothetical protein